MQYLVSNYAKYIRIKQIGYIDGKYINLCIVYLEHKYPI